MDVALYDDIADPNSADPLQPNASRVACAVSFAGPTDWSLLGSLDHKHPAYGLLIGYKPGTPASEMDSAKLEDVSPISFVSKDDPPIMQVHGNVHDIVPIEHARVMLRLEDSDFTSELIEIASGNHSFAGTGGHVSERAETFARSLLKQSTRVAQRPGNSSSNPSQLTLRQSLGAEDDG